MCQKPAHVVAESSIAYVASPFFRVTRFLLQLNNLCDPVIALMCSIMRTIWLRPGILRSVIRRCQGFYLKVFQGTDWLSLNVTRCNHGSHENEAFVTFFARYREKTNIQAIHECSRFLREDQRWYYVDGTAPPVGRNDRCPCGSEKNTKMLWLS